MAAGQYSEVLGLSTEVVIGSDEGLPSTSAIRCDFLTLIFKRKRRCGPDPHEWWYGLDLWRHGPLR